MRFAGRDLGDGTVVQFAVDIGDRKRAEQALRESESTLRRNQVWLAAQKEAFQATVNGAPLENSLGILIRTAVEQAKSDHR
jgi:two-component system, chemotaxis family, CheB/CheR fusion protein